MTNQEAVDDIIVEMARSNVLPDAIRERFVNSTFPHLVQIANTNPDAIIYRAKKLMEFWTPEMMNTSMYTNIYSQPARGYQEQVNWLCANTPNQEALETCLEVYRLFSGIGVTITLQQAHFVWRYISSTLGDTWVYCNCNDTICWGWILENFIFRQQSIVLDYIGI